MEDHFSGRTVLVTGACGTVGAELVRQLAARPTEHVICLDNNESELFFLLESLRGTGKVSGHLADVRDVEALSLRMRGVDVVLHAAALKHVGLCEDSPNQAIQTNILGTQNVIAAALHNGVGRVLFTSSDKAVNPTNVMGTSKLMGERLMTAAAETQGGLAQGEGQLAGTVFASTRFGNVLGSRGSVVPLFKKQIQNGGPITLTDREMTRFVMTLKDAATLVLQSTWLATAGEVFITKMPVARIEDIAEVMRMELAECADMRIDEIGSKPGEKMYEELMNEEEVRRSYELDNFFVVMPAFIKQDDERYDYLACAARPREPYNSALQPRLSRNDLHSYFTANGLFH